MNGPRGWPRRVASLFWKPGAQARRAEALLLAGDPAAARPLLMDAIARAPAWGELSYLLGRCEGAAGSSAAEEDLYRRALELDPDHRLAREALAAARSRRYQPVAWAWHLYHGGRTYEAIDAFAAALGPPEYAGEAHAGMGWCYYDLQSYLDARACFARAAAADPGLAQAHKGLGMSLWWLGLYEEAERPLQAALDLNEELDDARSFLGWCFYKRGQYEEALRRFLMAVETHPLAADQKWGVAWCSAKLDRPDEAVAGFLAAIDAGAGHPGRWGLVNLAFSNPAYRTVLLPLGYGLIRCGLAGDARVVFGRMLPDARAATGLAAALLACGEAHHVPPLLADAEMDAAGPDGVTPRQLLGRAALALGRVQEAVRILLMTDSSDLDLAEAHLAAGDLDAAESRLDEVSAGERALLLRREIDRRRREPLLRAVEAFRKGDPAAGLQVLDAAPAPPREDRWKAAIVRGRMLMALGRANEAETEFRRATTEAPENPQPILWHARALCESGRREEADRCVRAGVERHPDHVDLLLAGAALGLRRRWRAKALRLAPGSTGAWLPISEATHG